MRASLTPSEALLWARIRGRRLGVVFRRQVPLLGRLIADFLAPAQAPCDRGRWRASGRAGSRGCAPVMQRWLRLDAALVIDDIEAAVTRVRAALTP